jgi:pimeloyl-ACP methyl ester carboxylesterase
MNYQILILHGWGSCSKNWAEVKSYLENKGFKVYVPDLPGFGQNFPPKDVWSIADYAEWVRTYCKEKNLQQFFLLGHSFGGAISLKFSLKYPEKVKKLFLVAPAIIRKKSLKKEIIKKIVKPFSFLPDAAKKIIYIKILKSDYPLKRGIMRDIFLKVIKEDQLEDCSGISVPTVIIWGEKDDVTPIKDAYLIHKKINGSKLVIIKNQKHDLNRKAPLLLAERILENIE